MHLPNLGVDRCILKFIIKNKYIHGLRVRISTILKTFDQFHIARGISTSLIISPTINIFIYLYILFYLEFEENHRRTGQFVHKNETVSHINVSNKFSIHSSNILQL